MCPLSSPSEVSKGLGMTLKQLNEPLGKKAFLIAAVDQCRALVSILPDTGYC